jgi:hypothetical protein
VSSFVTWVKRSFCPDFEPREILKSKNGSLLPKYIASYLFYHGKPVDTRFPDGSLVGCLGNKEASLRAARSSISSFYSAFPLGGEAFDWSDQHKRYVGNPALSTEVTKQYQSLIREKQRQGEQKESVKAITVDDLKCLWLDKEQCKSNSMDEYIMKQTIYTASLVAFLCMLRSDEVTNIKQKMYGSRSGTQTE